MTIANIAKTNSQTVNENRIFSNSLKFLNIFPENLYAPKNELGVAVNMNISKAFETLVGKILSIP